MAGTKTVGNSTGNENVTNGKMPMEGPRVIPISLDFTIFDTYNIDFTTQQISNQFSMCQTVYVDNSDNSAAFSLTCGVTGQRLIWPPNSMGYLPVLQPNPPVFVASTTVAAVIVTVQFMNFYMPPIVWKKT